MLVPFTKDIVDLAIQYRQIRKMSIGDAIHAATAILHNLEVQTRNVSDFSHISGLRVSNPVWR